MIKSKLLIAGVSGTALAGSVLFGATAFAAPAAPTVLKACVVNKGGAMYQVPATQSKCAAGQHLITWNLSGIAGKDGAAGKNGTNGTNGTNGKDGATGIAGTHIVAHSGKPTGADKAAARSGDLFLDTATGTLSVFNGSGYAPAGMVLKGDKGEQGNDGYDGAAGADGSRIYSGSGAPSDAVKAKANDGDLYLDTAAATLSVFDGDVFGTPVSLVGPKGDKGDKGDAGAAGSQIQTGTVDPSDAAGTKAGDLYLNTASGELWVSDGSTFVDAGSLKGKAGNDGKAGTKIVTGAGAPTPEANGAGLNAGDLYLDTTAGDLYSFDGTGFAQQSALAGAPGKDGKDGTNGTNGTNGKDGTNGTNGKSVSVVSEAVASPTIDPATSTMTLSCGLGETAIGAGFANVPQGVQLVSSDTGTKATDWVLTFSADPTGATGHVLCAVLPAS